ncbi:MAG: very short patch repair endonuclease [Rhodospirillaceae bacterium]|nr:very short patch repair endonuclease [Rhodospirillaceae bacterium]
MADKISKERRSWNMSRIRSKDMKPEMVVRRLVHGMGYRYRLHRKDLPGKPDLVFGPRRKAIFVHGCFWHQHGDPECKISRIPRSRPEYWITKLERNKDRDTCNIEALHAEGWRTLVVWECRTKDTEKLRQQIHNFLSH